MLNKGVFNAYVLIIRKQFITLEPSKLSMAHVQLNSHFSYLIFQKSGNLWNFI